MEPKTYSSRHVNVTLEYHTVTHTDDSDFLTIEPHGEGDQKIVGADGSVSVGIDPDWTATVKITVQQTSPTADWAQKRYDMDQQTGIKHFFPVMVHNLTGTEIFHAEYAWVAERPTRAFGKGAPSNSIEITIETGDATWDTA